MNRTQNDRPLEWKSPVGERGDGMGCDRTLVATVEPVSTLITAPNPESPLSPARYT
jgi:hypothetical protein